MKVKVTRGCRNCYKIEFCPTNHQSKTHYHHYKSTEPAEASNMIEEMSDEDAWQLDEILTDITGYWAILIPGEIFTVFQRLMGSCDFCKVDCTDQLKSCVCKKVSYCSKECQAKDWKTHKPSCPPFIIKESPGKGKGLFATRRIKEGQIIVDEYPLLILRDGISLNEFKTHHYPNLDKETKDRILKLNSWSDEHTTCIASIISETNGNNIN